MIKKREKNPIITTVMFSGQEPSTCANVEVSCKYLNIFVLC